MERSPGAGAASETKGATPLLVLLAGLALGGEYLSYRLSTHHLAVYSGGVSEGLFCGKPRGSLDCTDVALHESSWLLGVPLSTWGLAFYGAILGIALAAAALRGEDRKTMLAVGAVASAGALGFDLYLGYVMLARIGSVCLDCVATYAVNLGLALGFALLLRRATGRFSWACLLPSPKARGSEVDYYRRLLETGLAGITLALAAAAFFWTLRPIRAVRAYGEEAVAALLESIRSSPPEVDMVRFRDQPALGAAVPAVELVLLGDFQCDLCRSIANTAEKLRRRWPDRILLRFVNSPLCTDCNPSVPENVHPDACWLAEVGECAEEQGQFWAFHAYLYERMRFADVDREHVSGHFGDAGLDEPVLLACLDYGRGQEALARDLTLEIELGLTATPTTIVNGHVKPGSMFPWMLEAIVSSLIEGRG